MMQPALRAHFEHANPILSVADMSRSLRYYTQVLGFTNADWGGDYFTCVSRDGASIYLSLRREIVHEMHGIGNKELKRKRYLD